MGALNACCNQKLSRAEKTLSKVKYLEKLKVTGTFKTYLSSQSPNERFFALGNQIKLAIMISILHVTFIFITSIRK